MTLGPLHEATRDLHHACEAHPVGAAMAAGNPPIKWYGAWVNALSAIHEVTDLFVPDYVDRRPGLRADLAALNVDPRSAPAAADRYANDLLFAPLFSPMFVPQAIEGALYVLIGAHLFGGEIMRRRLGDLPTQHLLWQDRQAAVAWFKPLREREELVEQARRCFGVLLATMDEIEKS